MRLLFCLAAIAAILGNCNNQSRQNSLADRTIEYQSGTNEYSVIVVEMQGLTMKGARRIAEKRAAERAFGGGYRYIVFKAMQKTEVIETDRPWPDNRSGNLYKEVILDGDFNRARQATPNEGVYSAYRFVFKAAKTKTSWQAIDVCTLTPCQ